MAKKKKDDIWGENGFEDWGGYMAAKKAKLEDQFRNEANKEFKEASNLFEGIAIFVNGYTDPTADELRRLMMAHGGVYHHYMRPRMTTHIIASNLPHSKIILYRKSQNPIPICKPQWITDSIKMGKVLNFQNYLLYSNCTDVQPQLKYKVKDSEHSKNVCLNVHDNTEKNSSIKISENIDNTSKMVERVIEDEDIAHPVKDVNAKNILSTKNSEFLSEFYSHSRLHHIATMGATFKEYVNELRDKSNGKFPGLDRLKELKVNKQLSGIESSFNDELLDQHDEKEEVNLGSVIMHIDMDCFFVSVGIRNKPELKGLPVAVTHAKGNKHPSTENREIVGSSAYNDDEQGSMSEVASCSYIARKAGVKNGMFLGEALKMCPNLKTIPYDFEGYTEVSYKLYDTVASYTLEIEAVSCDEMYANCTKILEESSLTPMEFATLIREEIKEKTGCPVSTGFGGNKLLARLATRKAKPDGQFYIKKECIETFIGTFNVQDLPGVGGTTAHKLNTISVRTCAELQAIPSTVLQKEFGQKTGKVLYNMCRGIDDTKLNLEHVRKSISAEVNYGIRFDNNDEAVDFLKKLSGEVCCRLKKASAKGRCITLKLMVRAKEAPKETTKFMGHGLCYYMTKSKNLLVPVNDVDVIAKEVITLWTQFQQLPEDARGIGIQISRLEILKNKQRDGSLTSFMNKNKSSGVSTRLVDPNVCNEIQPCSDSKITDKSLQSKDLKAFFPPKEAGSTLVTDTKSRATTSCTASVSGNSNLGTSHNLHVPPNISQSILAELPEDIRNEILNVRDERHVVNVSSAKEKDVRVPKSNENILEKNVQTHQENFFKHTKSSSGKSMKVEMPSIQEIDMSVLIELPEDIRNEILNEYSSKKRQNKASITTIQTSDAVTTTKKTVITKENPEEENISFSEVDPEFLAALSEDLKRDVQMYCALTKTKAVKKNEEIEHSGESIKRPSAPKQNKKVERISKVKSSSKNTKIVASKHNRVKGIKAAFKTLENKRDNSGNIKSVIASVNMPEISTRTITPDETEIILSHNRTITQNIEGSSHHQQTLIDLVNHLFHLPLIQVKMQIQMWITNSKVVNEVDFLSLATFLSMLPEKKRIEDLLILLKTMHRYMTKTGNCIWHRTYRKTVKHVQHYMQIEYNSNLMVPPIKCNLLQCNSDVM